MPFFYLHSNYIFILNLISGFLYFLGIFFLGRFIHKTLFNEKNDNFQYVFQSATPVLGVLLVSLMIQIPGFFGFQWFKYWISFLFYFIIFIGILGLIFSLKEIEKIKTFKWKNIFFLLVIFILINSFLISMAPLTKHDEFFYHAVFPGRIVLDNAINFYKYPLESAVLPHMIFHISTVPLFAVEFPNSANLFSYLFSILLFYLLYKNLSEKFDEKSYEVDKHKIVFLLLLFSMIGMHHLVFHPTLGGHAFNEFCLFCLLLLIYKRQQIIRDDVYYFYISVLSIGVLGSKFSYLPIISIIWIYFSWQVIKSSNYNLLLIFYLPIFLFYIPIIIFTYYKSGCPFGPFLVEFFGSKIYSIEEIKNFMDVYHKKLPYLNVDVSFFLKSIIFDYSILILMSLFIVLVRGYILDKFIWVLSLIMLIIIYLKLPHDIRFFGGFLYFCLLLSLRNAFFKSFVLKILENKRFFKATMIYLFSFILITAVYNYKNYKFYLSNDKFKWMIENIGLYEDYIKIDKIIEKDSVILLTGTRGNGAYSPRLVVYSYEDLLMHKNKKKYLISVGQEPIQINYKGYTLRKIYENNNAMITSFRTPLKNKEYNKLTLYLLEEQG